MTDLYPRERVESISRRLKIPVVHRILLKTLTTEPLSVRSAPSRFCDGFSFSVLYAAADFATSFIEVVVRDRFVQREQRIIPYDDIQTRAWIEIELPPANPLLLADLRGSGCVTLGAPTDAAHARNQTAGRALARTLYQHHADIDGIWYQSRLTGGECFAIFDRAIVRLSPIRTGQLVHHPQLPQVLDAHEIRLET
jgi:RES domain